MNKNIRAGRPKTEKFCRNCGEVFGWPEFSSFMLSNDPHIDCIRCQKPNFIIPRKTISYYLATIFAVLIGLFIFCACLWLSKTAWEYTGLWGIIVAGPLLLIGFALNFVAARSIKRIYFWFAADLSLADPKAI